MEEQLRPHGVFDERVLAAMSGLPREEFVPASQRRHAYADHPLAIGGGQTISQPLIVGSATQAIAPRPEDAVLEIGAGSGYQVAVLARLCRSVVGIELDPELAARSAATLGRLGIHNAVIHQGDGLLGWPAGAPFDGIVVSAAARQIPEALIEQLAEGGRMVIPVETGRPDLQDLLLCWKAGGRLETRVMFQVRFVPLLG